MLQNCFMNHSAIEEEIMVIAENLRDGSSDLLFNEFARGTNIK